MAALGPSTFIFIFMVMSVTLAMVYDDGKHGERSVQFPGKGLRSLDATGLLCLCYSLLALTVVALRLGMGPLVGRSGTGRTDADMFSFGLAVAMALALLGAGIARRASRIHVGPLGIRWGTLRWGRRAFLPWSSVSKVALSTVPSGQVLLWCNRCPIRQVSRGGASGSRFTLQLNRFSSRRAVLEVMLAGLPEDCIVDPDVYAYLDRLASTDQ